MKAPENPALFNDVKIGVYDLLLVNLQDLLSFRVTVGLSIIRNMIFVRLCRLVDKESILMHGPEMENKSSWLYLVRCGTSNELMRPLSFVWSVGHLIKGWRRWWIWIWLNSKEMKTTDLVVCLSLIGVVAEPAHDFNICALSEGEKDGKRDTGQLRL